MLSEITEKITNVLSFDIEDWFHILDLRHNDIPSKLSHYQSRVEHNTTKLLNILYRKHTKATFFVLGWIAEKHSNLVKEIHNHGHEIGCHGYAHQLISTLTRQQFRDDILKASDTIGNLTNQQPVSYRGPGFSITPQNDWALEVIAECGFECDSTIYPGRHGHGGHPRFSSEPVMLKFDNSGTRLFEFPVSVSKVLGKRMCFSGGGYLRLLPYLVIKKKCHEFNEQRKPVMVYLHPREIDPLGPRLPMPIKRRFKSYFNVKKTERKLTQLLDDFNFTTLHNYYKNHFEVSQHLMNI